MIQTVCISLCLSAFDMLVPGLFLDGPNLGNILQLEDVILVCAKMADVRCIPN